MLFGNPLRAATSRSGSASPGRSEGRQQLGRSARPTSRDRDLSPERLSEVLMGLLPVETGYRNARAARGRGRQVFSGRNYATAFRVAQCSKLHAVENARWTNQAYVRLFCRLLYRFRVARCATRPTRLVFRLDVVPSTASRVLSTWPAFSSTLETSASPSPGCVRSTACRSICAPGRSTRWSAKTVPASRR